MAHYKCVICGRKIARRIKLPAGSISLCSEQECLDTLTYRVNDAVPIVWFSYEDLKNHEVAASEVLDSKQFHNDKLVNELADSMDTFIWGGSSFGDLFDEALKEAGEELEMKFIKAIPKEDLPLYINIKWVSDDAQETFRNLLDEGNKHVL